MRINIDAKFIAFLKEDLKNPNPLNALNITRFLTEYSFNEIFLAEKNRKITKNDLESFLRREGGINQILNLLELSTNDYQINETTDFQLFESLSQMNFMNFTDNQVNTLSNKYGYIFSNINNFVSIWRLLSINNLFSETYSISFTNAINQSFQNQFLNYQTSCNSILIVDRYIRSNTWNPITIQNNLFPLIETLAYQGKNTNSFHLTIITGGKNQNFGGSSQNFYDYIEQHFNSFFANLKFTYIHVQENNFNGLGLLKTKIQNIIHDRHIMTNYFHIASQHSLDMFDNTNSTMKSTEINIKSLINPSHFEAFNNKRDAFKELAKIYNNHPNNFEVIGGNFQDNPLLRL